MWRLLKFLVTGDGHLHTYEVIREASYEDGYGERWSRYYCRCTKCGIVKKFD